MLDRQDDTSAAPKDLHVCEACHRDFIVPVSVLDLVGYDRCIVELACMNCGTAALGVHDDRTLMALDEHLDAAQGLMRDAVEVLAIADDLERVDRFVRALRADQILPEDF